MKLYLCLLLFNSSIMTYCKHISCANEPMPDVTVCDKHRCTIHFKTYDYHTPQPPRCKNMIATARDVCQLHTCKYRDCQNHIMLTYGLLDLSRNVFACRSHKCQIDGCYLEQFVRSNTCIFHTCRIENCFEMAPLKWGTKRLCEKHTCIIEDCFEMSKTDNGMCSNHESEDMMPPK